MLSKIAALKYPVERTDFSLEGSYTLFTGKRIKVGRKRLIGIPGDRIAGIKNILNHGSEIRIHESQSNLSGIPIGYRYLNRWNLSEIGNRINELTNIYAVC